ncbi:HAD-IA family hydrolase [Nanoarchaeota archaeon]
MARGPAINNWQERLNSSKVIKELVLDVGSTLVHPVGEPNRIGECLSELGINAEVALKLDKKYSHQLDLGLMDYQDIIDEYNEITGNSITVEEYFDKLFKCINFNTRLIDFCKASPLRKHILSDNHPHNIEKYEEIQKFSEWTTVQIWSCEVGVAKPDPRIYQILFEKANVKPEECLFIDDKQRNIDAARELGMLGIVFEGNDKLFPKLERLGLLPKPL